MKELTQRELFRLLNNLSIYLLVQLDNPDVEIIYDKREEIIQIRISHYSVSLRESL